MWRKRICRVHPPFQFMFSDLKGCQIQDGAQWERLKAQTLPPRLCYILAGDLNKMQRWKGQCESQLWPGHFHLSFMGNLQVYRKQNCIPPTKHFKCNTVTAYSEKPVTFFKGGGGVALLENHASYSLQTQSLYQKGTWGLFTPNGYPIIYMAKRSLWCCSAFTETLLLARESGSLGTLFPWMKLWLFLGSHAVF